ncbi:hypothetical protein K0M31_019324 [Melipona bicolor]|uniref:Uncharacterized protein n=1 Tax=Melipona bicolor TaxID=60889 RepID=A0AA40G2J2_9HYME|nr:hypothetical protein K0M31_019324 [Melipona bicolor]
MKHHDDHGNDNYDDDDDDDDDGDGDDGDDDDSRRRRRRRRRRQRQRQRRVYDDRGKSSLLFRVLESLTEEEPKLTRVCGSRETLSPSPSGAGGGALLRPRASD